MATSAQVRDAILGYLEANKASFGYPNVPAVVMLAQSALETGNWTSSAMWNHNNVFGMHANSRNYANHTWVGDGGATLAGYEDIYASCGDYLARQRQFHIPDGDGVDYMQATVDSGYAADPDYLSKWAAKVLELSGEPVAETSEEGGSILVPLLLAVAALS